MAVQIRPSLETAEEPDHEPEDLGIVGIGAEEAQNLVEGLHLAGAREPQATHLAKQLDLPDRGVSSMGRLESFELFEETGPTQRHDGTLPGWMGEIVKTTDLGSECYQDDGVRRRIP
jgi:hypothetical protein